MKIKTTVPTTKWHGGGSVISGAGLLFLDTRNPKHAEEKIDSVKPPIYSNSVFEEAKA